MCTSLVTSPELELTRQQAGDRWSTVHSLLHRHITPWKATDIIAKHHAVSLLSDYRGYKVERDGDQEEERVGDVLAFTEVSGLEHDLKVYTSLEEKDKDTLWGNDFSGL